MDPPFSRTRTARTAGSGARGAPTPYSSGAKMAGPPAALQAATPQLGRAENPLGVAAAFWPAKPALRGGDQPLAQTVGAHPETAAAAPQRTGAGPAGLDRRAA